VPELLWQKGKCCVTKKVIYHLGFLQVLIQFLQVFYLERKEVRNHRFLIKTNLQVLYRRWPFGPGTELLCQFANACRATPVFMSSFAIGAIAVDRYRCILQPDKPDLSLRASTVISIILGMVSVLVNKTLSKFT